MDNERLQEIENVLDAARRLRAQLAEARAVTKRHKVCKDCNILRQELAEAQVENERLQKVSEEFKQYMPFLASHGYFETTDTRLKE